MQSKGYWPKTRRFTVKYVPVNSMQMLQGIAKFNRALAKAETVEEVHAFSRWQDVVLTHAYKHDVSDMIHTVRNAIWRIESREKMEEMYRIEEARKRNDT